MVERGEQARLAQQLAEVEVLLVRNLERDLLVDPGVVGQEDRAKSSAADGRVDLVFPDDLTAKEHAREYTGSGFLVHEGSNRVRCFVMSFVSS